MIFLSNVVQDEIPIRNFVTLFGRRPPVVWPDQKLGEVFQLNTALYEHPFNSSMVFLLIVQVLKMFRQSHGHMAIVRDVCNSGPVGDAN
jgi:hypothetical protein